MADVIDRGLNLLVNSAENVHANKRVSIAVESSH